jgi:hypothetical protein
MTRHQKHPQINRDWREFIELLNSNGVDYLITGAWCVAFHAEPRATGDLDIIIRRTPETAAKMEKIMREFGFITEPQLTENDFLTPNMVFQLGYKPNRIDLLTDCLPVQFEAAWTKRHEISVNGLSMKFLDRDSLIECKQAAARPKDLADIELLQRTRPIDKMPEGQFERPKKQSPPPKPEISDVPEPEHDDGFDFEW